MDLGSHRTVKTSINAGTTHTWDGPHYLFIEVQDWPLITVGVAGITIGDSEDDKSEFHSMGSSSKTVELNETTIEVRAPNSTKIISWTRLANPTADAHSDLSKGST